MADYIDRREAFEIASDLRDCISVEGYWAWVERIKRLPSEDVAPVRHGRWGKVNECSECGCQPWYERDINFLHYCPNCGARMDGEA